MDLPEWVSLRQDENAAKNILNEGLKIIGTELSDNTGGEELRLEFQPHFVKPEAQPIAYGLGG